MLRPFLLLYSIIYCIGLVGYLFAAIFRYLGRKKRTAIWERLRPPLPLGQTRQSGSIKVVWIHAVSVGEANAAKPILHALAQRPNLHIFLSTITVTGQQVARAMSSSKVTVFYFPLDLGPICGAFLKRISPDLVLLVETELWPNFLATARKQSVPVLLLNGRLSDHSFRSYSRITFFLRPLLEGMAHCCMQSKEDKKRIVSLGAPAGKVSWVGNLKYDYTIPEDDTTAELCDRIYRLLNLEDNLLWLCGSTKPGEEEILLEVFRNLSEEFSTLRLLLAPRHPERGGEIARIVARFGFGFARRSQLPKIPVSERKQVLILDSIGELAHLYRLADFVFMGGSLVPTGGQNIIEPAAFGKPILFGPHMGNFREIAQAFKQDYAALQVESGEELCEKARELIRDPNVRVWLGRNARRVIRNNQGAIDRSLSIIDEYLKRTEGSP